MSQASQGEGQGQESAYETVRLMTESDPQINGRGPCRVPLMKGEAPAQRLPAYARKFNSVPSGGLRAAAPTRFLELDPSCSPL